MTKFHRFLALLCFLLSCLYGQVLGKASSSTQSVYSGLIVIDAATGRLLVEDNADDVSPPASMTKLMTFAVVADKIASGALTRETLVKITNEDSKIGGTQVYLDARETFSLDELLYAMMIQSANDAAHAVARISAGSVEAFVGLMNAKAQELGMTHTTFRSPHGLPPSSRHKADGDLTTPRDYALLCRYLLGHTNVLQYSSVQHRDFGLNRKQGPQHMKNHNNLLGKVAGVDGLKTGYTASAGYCLSATAERRGRRVIVVIMGSFGPNGQRDLGKTRDLKAIELIERGFTALASSLPNNLPTTVNSPTAVIPTVKTLESAGSAPEQSSTPPADGFTFRVGPLVKKP